MPLKRQCPKDGTLMSRILYDSYALDQCTLCGGTWCDGWELETMLSTQGKKFTESEIKAVKFLDRIPVLELERTKTLLCVSCQKPLIKKNLKSKSKISINVCPQGH